MDLAKRQRAAEAGLARRRNGKRHFWDHQRLQPLVQHGERPEGHASSDSARIKQPAVSFVIAQQQRAEAVARSLRVRPSDDHEFGTAKAFALEPDATIAGQIAAVDSL
jgi:hypothetical protein